MPTFKAVTLVAKNQVKNDQTTNIKIRLTHKRKVVYISTDLYINPAFFDNKQGVATGGGSEEHINITLGRTITDYREAVYKLGDYRNHMSAADIRNHIQSGIVKDGVIDFYSYADKLISETPNEGTANVYRSTLESLKMFKENELLASQITLNFLYAYERFLRERNVGNGIVNYMKTFRAMFNKCRDFYNDEDTGQIRIPNYPFRKYKMPRRNTSSNEHVLTATELLRFIKYRPENEREQFAKDMFLLMFYLQGIEAKDLFFLGKAYRKRVKYQRFKTGGEFSIRTEPEAVELITRNAGKNTLINAADKFADHKNFTRFLNDYLHGRVASKKQAAVKGIFAKIGINKKVTTKWARHTWATIARNDCRISKDDVALCLGHKDQSNRVTDIYIKYDTSIIDATNRKVLDYIKKV